MGLIDVSFIKWVCLSLPFGGLERDEDRRYPAGSEVVFVCVPESMGNLGDRLVLRELMHYCTYTNTFT